MTDLEDAEPLNASQPSASSTLFPRTRFATAWPFASDDWANHPRGADAELVNAGLIPRTAPYHADQVPVLMDANQPFAAVFQNGGQHADRCTGSGMLGVINVPEAFVVPTSPDNFEFAAIRDDVVTSTVVPVASEFALPSRYEGGMFARCAPGAKVTAGHMREYGPLEGSSVPGGCGGSGLSTLAGVIRLGELVPGGTIRHALRVNLCGRTDFFPEPGFRWPAIRADNYAHDAADPRHYAGSVPGLCNGTLLTIPATADLTALRTAPARILARALIRYGCRPSNDTVTLSWAFTLEYGTTDTVELEFERAWGFPFAVHPGASPWGQDLDLLLSLLEIVTDDGPNLIGGAGAPLAPFAPPFAP